MMTTRIRVRGSLLSWICSDELVSVSVGRYYRVGMGDLQKRGPGRHFGRCGIVVNGCDSSVGERTSQIELSSTYRKYPDEAPAAPTKIHLRIGIGIVHKIYQPHHPTNSASSACFHPSTISTQNESSRTPPTLTETGTQTTIPYPQIAHASGNVHPAAPAAPEPLSTSFPPTLRAKYLVSAQKAAGKARP
jgi:hypothetical protein